ncbi:MAG: ribosome biogenesis GTP-binding protein YihA/YsxC [Acidimicrobiia bacterium]
MTAPLDLRFLASARDVSRLPPSRAEVAVVGRSNVGKSSLLNALGRRRNLAPVSKNPGRTRVLHCYGVGPGSDDGRGATVVDCPGYGYAAVPRTERAAWRRTIEGYLLERPQLEMTVVLVDGEIGPTRLDTEMLGWLAGHGLPHAVVATKHDKVKASRRERRKRELAAACGLEPSDVVWVSAVKGTGIDRLRALVRLWLGMK